MNSQELNLFFTQASSNEAIGKAFSIDVEQTFRAAYRVLPNEKLRVILPSEQGSDLVEATWGIKEVGSGTLYHLGTKKALSKRPFSILIRKQRCVVPVNCVVIQSDKSTKLIRVLGHRIFALGALYQRRKSFSGERLEVSLLSTESPDILSGISRVGPVFFEPEAAVKWISPSTLEQVLYRCDGSSRYWFDYYPVHPAVFDRETIEANDLEPAGLSRNAIESRKHKLKQLEIKKLRQNRTGK